MLAYLLAFIPVCMHAGMRNVRKCFITCIHMDPKCRVVSGNGKSVLKVVGGSIPRRDHELFIKGHNVLNNIVIMINNQP